MPREVYVFTDSGERYRPGVEWTPLRITAVLDAGGGDIVREEFAWAAEDVVRRQRRRLDAEAAERFRTLLVDGGYVDLAPTGGWCSDNPLRTLESCIQGRYYGVVRRCVQTEYKSEPRRGRRARA